MFMRYSMRSKPWYPLRMVQFMNGMKVAMDAFSERKDYLALHPTRIYEYPWALEYCRPNGNILDVGTNNQFHVSLLGQGFPVTAHGTFLDTRGFGRMFAWEDDYRGGISLDECYTKYKHEFTYVLGLFEDLSFVKPEWFDTIYCLSVLEHVEYANAHKWIEGMWKLLKPGGKLCLTCDWYSEFATGDGIESKVINHDVGEMLKSCKGAKIDTPTTELPWHPDFDMSVLNDDVQCVTWETNSLIVYGVVITKTE